MDTITRTRQLLGESLNVLSEGYEFKRKGKVIKKADPESYGDRDKEVMVYENDVFKLESYKISSMVYAKLYTKNDELIYPFNNPINLTPLLKELETLATEFSLDSDLKTIKDDEQKMGQFRNKIYDIARKVKK